MAGFCFAMAIPDFISIAFQLYPRKRSWVFYCANLALLQRLARIAMWKKMGLNCNIHNNRKEDKHGFVSNAGKTS